jgi:hypothetical protein
MLRRVAPHSAAKHLFRTHYMSDTPVAPLLVGFAEARRLLSAGKTKLNDLCNAEELDRRHIGRYALITMESVSAVHR